MPTDGSRIVMSVALRIETEMGGKVIYPELGANAILGHLPSIVDYAFQGQKRSTQMRITNRGLKDAEKLQWALSCGVNQFVNYVGMVTNPIHRIKLPVPKGRKEVKGKTVLFAAFSVYRLAIQVVKTAVCATLNRRMAKTGPQSATKAVLGV